MKFLVILLTVVITYFWQQDLDQIDDRWFFALRRNIEKQLATGPQLQQSGWFVLFVLTFFIPLLLLTLLLWLSGDWLFGIVALLIHLFVLLMAFDRIHPGLLAKKFQQFCAQGDSAAAYQLLEREMGCTDMPAANDWQALHETFGRLYVYRCFEKMFVTFFWYLLAGPQGVMLAYLCYQLRDAVLFGSDSPEAGSVNSMIMVLEWLPQRLLGATFCLMGNFEACFARLRRSGLVSDTATDQTVYEYARCALGDELEGGETPQARRPEFAENSSRQHLMSAELTALKGLMDRSQYTWLSVIALLTVLGGQF
jgi:AmpE protein